MELRVFLKVCEGCGCLWYRAQAEIGVYCSSCHDRFKEFPTPRSRKRSGRPKKLTLPTVFAVQAPAHSELDFALDFWGETTGEFQRRHTHGLPAPSAAYGASCSGGAQ
jgi:CRISPR-associated Cas5-like protein